MLQDKYYQIMREFLKGYCREIYGSDLVKNVSLSQKNIALTLIELQKKGILNCKTSGNRKYYSINTTNPLIKDCLVLFELLRKIEFLEQNKKMSDFSKEVEGEIVSIFGSYAKDTQSKDSDLDVFIVGRADSSKIRKIGKKYGYDVQVFNLSLNDFKKSVLSKSTLVQEVLDAHVILGGADKFVSVVLNG